MPVFLIARVSTIKLSDTTGFHPAQSEGFEVLESVKIYPNILLLKIISERINITPGGFPSSGECSSLRMRYVKAEGSLYAVGRLDGMEPFGLSQHVRNDCWFEHSSRIRACFRGVSV